MDKRFKLKSFLLIIYGVAGLIISLFTAVMTYIIIGEPIGTKMTSKIMMTVLATLPVIGVVSYLIGNNLSKKFTHISTRLKAIHEGEFLQDNVSEMIVDIDEIHQEINYLSARLEKTIMQLKKNNQNLSAIVKSLSHDIKTPLTIIDGYLEECKDNLISVVEMPRIIAILQKETVYLNELSSEAIRYIQSQEFIDKQTSFNLKTFIHEEVCPLLKVKESVTLKCLIDDDLIFTFNEMALKKILVNLLYNATKYTEQGTIKLIATDDTIIVEDTGIGIKEKDAERIFVPFNTLDVSKNREKSGYGLGLSIARNLAENNGYNLFLDTQYKDGSRFVLKKKV